MGRLAVTGFRGGRQPGGDRVTQSYMAQLAKAMVLAEEMAMRLGNMAADLRKQGFKVELSGDTMVIRTPDEPGWKPSDHRFAGCPDGGVCGHWCGNDKPCFRVTSCAPFTGYYPDEPDGSWPEKVRLAEESRGNDHG
jgi:hypothetical protein